MICQFEGYLSEPFCDAITESVDLAATQVLAAQIMSDTTDRLSYIHLENKLHVQHKQECQ